MSNSLALIPLADVERMASAMAKAGLFGFKQPEQALALMLVAQAEGQHPATIAQDYDIIQGRAARKTHSVLARFQSAGGRIEWHTLSDTMADATFSHAQGGSLRMSWSIDQAKKAGLTGKDNWRNYPRAMLRARCIAEGVRAVYPAALGGMLVAEEAHDLAPAKAPTVLQTVERVDCPPELLSAAEESALRGVEAYRTYWGGLTHAERGMLASHHAGLKGAAKEADEARTLEAAPVVDDFVAAMDAAE